MLSSRAVLRPLLLLSAALAACALAEQPSDSGYSADAVNGSVPSPAPAPSIDGDGSVDASTSASINDQTASSSPFIDDDRRRAQCSDFFEHKCPKGAKDDRKAWLEMILAGNRDQEDQIKKDFSLATRFLSIEDGVHPEDQKSIRLTEGEKSKGQIEEIIKKECADFACLEKYYEPLLTFFTVYARDYEGRDDKGKRALAALEYMDRFKKTEDATAFAARVHMVAVSINRVRRYGVLKPSLFYSILLERSYVHKYRLSAEAQTGIPFAAIKKIVEEVPKKIEEELQKTAAGQSQTELLGLSYIDILREEWSNMKAPEDDNVEEALAFYRKAYGEGLALWKPFGSQTATILAHVSALYAVNKQYPGDILDLVSSDIRFDNERFMRAIQKADRLVLPESFLVESVYRTVDKNMGLFAFRLARIMLRRAFAESGTNLVQHMQDDAKNCTTAQFRETFLKLYKKSHTSREHGDDIYFMEAVQAALRTINKNGYEKAIVVDFYERLAKEYCHDERNGAYLVNGAARFFKPFTDAFGCKDGDNLHFVESSCLPLGSSNIHRRASSEL